MLHRDSIRNDSQSAAPLMFESLCASVGKNLSGTKWARYHRRMFSLQEARRRAGTVKCREKQLA